MNAQEIKKQLNALSKLPIELLSAAEIGKLGNNLKDTIHQIERLQILGKIEELQQSIPIESISFYKIFLSKIELKKPQKISNIEELIDYYNSLKNEIKSIEKLKKEYSKLLDKIENANEAKALELLDNTTEDDKKYLSALANLTVKTPKGSSKLVLSNSKTSIENWYAEFKKRNYHPID